MAQPAVVIGTAAVLLLHPDYSATEAREVRPGKRDREASDCLLDSELATDTLRPAAFGGPEALDATRPLW